MSDIFQSIEQSDRTKEILANLIAELVQELKGITEFNPNELRAISILQTNRYIAQFITFYLLNKKHLKRKYSPEVLKAFETLSTALSAMMAINQNAPPNPRNIQNR